MSDPDSSLTPEQRERLIEILRSGADVPREWQSVVFPPEKRECELVYGGKERAEEVISETMGLPLQPVRTFGRNGSSWSNMLVFGDNLQAMKTLLQLKRSGQLCNADGTPGARLAYIDPPFASKQDFRGSNNQKAYQDKLAGSDFLEFLRRRLILLRELLSDDGALFVHLDSRKGHYVKVLLDEVFGEHNFRNAIVWKRSDAHSDVSQGASHLGRIYDTIFFYAKGSATKLNPVYTPLPESTVEKWYRHVEEGTGRRYNMADTSGPGGARKGNPHYEWNGVTRYWRYSRQRMEELEKEGLLVYSASGIAYLKRYLDDSKGVPIQDWWDDIAMLRGIHKRKGAASITYPTQKPEELLERVIRSASDEGDLVLDAFAGSGTTSVVAERLKRRWVAIDCGKLAVYTVQHRMLHLTGEGEDATAPHPFTLYNAGLYDFSRLRELDWSDWRFFALQLFQCKDAPHRLGGIQLDGTLKGSDVLVFNHYEAAGAQVTYETLDDIHQAVGKKVGSRFFIIAPALCFAFQEDYVDMDGIRYYALRIPYSIIHELHSRDFTSIRQPVDEMEVNETVDSVGFDFIRTPEAKVSYRLVKNGAPEPRLTIRVTTFRSQPVAHAPQSIENLASLSLVLIDSDYDGEVFNLSEFFFAHQIREEKFTVRIPADRIGDRIMLVLVDTYGNEFREVRDRSELGLPKRAQAAKKSHAGKKRAKKSAGKKSAKKASAKKAAKKVSGSSSRAKKAPSRKSAKGK